MTVFYLSFLVAFVHPAHCTSFYVASKNLHVDHYQTLVDRGWRRSGTLLYKPDLQHSCCPHYTIRLPVAEFKARKDQRAALNRWNRHVVGEDYYREYAKLHPKSRKEKAKQRDEFVLTSAVHESECGKLERPPEPAHRYEVTLESDEFTEEKFALYKNYQIHVHKDTPSKITRSSFTRFLCSSPLKSSADRTFNGSLQRLGSYHQCYRLDGKLIAMGVLDLLPHCVSGVYFIYHSEVEQWSFGKISALREMCLALEGGYNYYYMGYYIHSCIKMRYKNDYKPQYFLDLETYDWNPLDEEARELLEKHHYLSLSREQKNKLEDGKKTDEKIISDRNGVNEQGRQTFESAVAAYHAIESGLSLFQVNFPGTMTEEQVEAAVDLDHVQLQLRAGVIVEAQDLVSWTEWSTRDARTPKGIIAQMTACVGPEVATQMVVCFGG